MVNIPLRSGDGGEEVLGGRQLVEGIAIEVGDDVCLSGDDGDVGEPLV
jgi:hypothetical protein